MVDTPSRRASTPADAVRSGADQRSLHVYFVAPCSLDNPCSSSSDGGTPVPTLKRLELLFGPTDRLEQVYLVTEIKDGAP